MISATFYYPLNIHVYIYLQHILFSGYRLESSYNNELSISIDLDSLVRATKVAQQSANTKIILRQKDGQPYLDWRISIEVIPIFF